LIKQEAIASPQHKVMDYSKIKGNQDPFASSTPAYPPASAPASAYAPASSAPTMDYSSTTTTALDYSKINQYGPTISVTTASSASSTAASSGSYPQSLKIFGYVSPESLTLVHEKLKKFKGDEPSVIWGISDEEASKQALEDAGVFDVTFLPCLWPQLLICWPIICCEYQSFLRVYKGTTYALGTKEPRALYRVRDHNDCFGDKVAPYSTQMRLKDIHSMKLNREDSDLCYCCVGSSANTIDIEVPAGHAMKPPTHQVTEWDTRLPLVMEKSYLDESYKILLSLMMKAKDEADDINNHVRVEKVDDAQVIEKLNELLAKGLLTQVEFDAKRQEVIQRM
jgi:hypothetical protein